MATTRKACTMTIGRTVSLVAALMLACAGCSTVLDSDRINQWSVDECLTSLGHYYLPKRYVNVEVTQADGARPAINLTVTDSYADPNYKYCLAFLGSALAEDSIAVERFEVNGKSRGLLKTVRSKADDKTKEVVDVVLDTVAAGLTGNPNLTHRALNQPRLEGNKLVNRTIDPFDPAQLAGINVELAEFGFCIKFDVPRAGQASFAAGCGRTAQLYRKSSPVAWLGDPASAKERRGVYYRPNLRRKFIVLQNDDADGKGKWREVQDYNFLMPNDAPIFSVDVTRSLFVSKETILEFDQGVLKNVVVDKPSELAAFVEIPLRIVEVAVAIPAQVVKVRINNTNNRAAIIATQQRLLDVQTKRKDLEEQLREKLERTASNGVPVVFPRSAPVTDGRSGERFSDPIFRDRAEERCGQHCNANRSRLGDPAQCAKVCLQRAQQCLSAEERPKAEECVTLGIEATAR